MARKFEFFTEQTRGSRFKFFREAARRELANLIVSQRWGSASLVETDFESSDG